MWVTVFAGLLLALLMWRSNALLKASAQMMGWSVQERYAGESLGRTTVTFTVTWLWTCLNNP